MADVSDIRPISRLLVANRGEIARRIFRTAREMGISTVAVYADGDAEAPFVREADVAVALNGRTSAETYLDSAKLLDACRRSGADAVHPGYGFLSESAGFARAVIAAGLNWVGPEPEVIAQMGDKLAAKKLMQAAGVPTLPAVELAGSGSVKAAARGIGYPILVKASAGGGGRGMRVVASEADLDGAVESARREAGSAFGDDAVFLERWLEKARHLEIQILGDRHGNLVHCFERECSIQRRHQKIIEEAPSPALDDETRAAMCAAALSAARELGYSSAGTVEFLLAGKEFWFLEVNARLQVEHPVTEAIIGKDLVREQIRIAEGERLSISQDDLRISGHAIEARLCAEDPQNGFLPAPGQVVVWRPSTSGRARFDSGVESGSVVSSDFDAMIAKVIVHAPTRREAAGRLARVLETTQVQGLTTNRDFLVATLRTAEFQAGDTTTDFIERVAPAPRRAPQRVELIDACIATALEGQARRRACAKVLRSMPTGWRNTVMPPELIAFTVGDERVDLAYRAGRDGRFRFVADGIERWVSAHRCGEGVVDLAIDGLRLEFRAENHGDRWFLHGAIGDLELIEQPRYPDVRAEDLSGGLKAPMPGVIRAVAVGAGDAVTKGQLLVVLEAMKMEHRIVAPQDGVVQETNVAVGEQVGNGQLLLTLAGKEDVG
ncbi:MAG: biotin carboxylase N-terminal domain-containing protein [Caulobacterales bacterium]